MICFVLKTNTQKVSILFLIWLMRCYNEQTAGIILLKVRGKSTGKNKENLSHKKPQGAPET